MAKRPGVQYAMLLEKVDQFIVKLHRGYHSSRLDKSDQLKNI